jgi:hypothetical protein
VNQAFERGITARQICTFLTNHAHERMLSSRPVVPETVCDQIMLWETEQVRKRTVFAPSYTKDEHFTKTGSGQTWGKVAKRGPFPPFFLVRSPTTG